MRLRYRILNVFTVDARRLSGNPLVVFEDGPALDDVTMIALARQMNLSETTFLLPPTDARASRRVRIFTPTHEMPFAGHPTLGTAHVVRRLTSGGDQVRLEMEVGIVDVSADGDHFTLETARAPTTRSAARPELLASALGLPVDRVVGGALFVNTGTEQLVIPLADEAAVRAARPRPDLLRAHAWSEAREGATAYVWARQGNDVLARYFFLQHDAVVEDPATGSACANLGGYLVATGAPLPQRLVVSQGEAVGRVSRLVLRVDETKRIFVGGDVVELGEGTIDL